MQLRRPVVVKTVFAAQLTAVDDSGASGDACSLVNPLVGGGKRGGLAAGTTNPRPMSLSALRGGPHPLHLPGAAATTASSRPTHPAVTRLPSAGEGEGAFAGTNPLRS